MVPLVLKRCLEHQAIIGQQSQVLLTVVITGSTDLTIVISHILDL